MTLEVVCGGSGRCEQWRGHQSRDPVNVMAYAQPHPRLSVLSSSSQSSTDHSTSTRFSLPNTQSKLNRPNIYDRNLNKTRTADVSGSAFAFLFSEIVQYTQKRVSGINDLERQ